MDSWILHPFSGKQLLSKFRLMFQMMSARVWHKGKATVETSQ